MWSKSLLIKTQSMLSLGFEFQETNGNSFEVTVHHSLKGWDFRLYTSLLVNWISVKHQTMQIFKRKKVWNIQRVQFHVYYFINFKLPRENVISRSTPDEGIALHQKETKVIIYNQWSCLYWSPDRKKSYPVLFFWGTTHTSATSDNRTKGFGMFALIHPYSL